MKLLRLIFLPALLISLWQACSKQAEVSNNSSAVNLINKVIPRFDHVILVVEENHSYSELIGSPDAPYINSLAMGGAIFTNSHGIAHPSQPNYLVLFSGSTQGITDDTCLDGTASFSTPNLGAALNTKGFSFKGYAQTMPNAGYLGCMYLYDTLTGGNLYARKHTPWVNWLGSGYNQIPPGSSLPMTAFPSNFDQLPTVAFVIPDMDHDMHNIGAQGNSAAIQRGDNWLKENLGPYAEWAKTHNSLLILTFDEDDSDAQNGNRVPTIFYGANILTGAFDESIDHYQILQTLETMYALPITMTAGQPIRNIWKK